MRAPLTVKGALRLRAELEELKSVKRPAVIAAIADHHQARPETLHYAIRLLDQLSRRAGRVGVFSQSGALAGTFLAEYSQKSWLGETVRFVADELAEDPREAAVRPR